jgi:two-component system, OmpR family, sensor histidine kinase BaeS
MKLEFRLAILLVLMAFTTGLLTVVLNDFQRQHTFRELQPDVREFLRSEGRFPPLGIPPELRGALNSGEVLLVRLEPSVAAPIFVLRTQNDPTEFRLRPARRRINLEQQLGQNLLIATIVSTVLGSLLAFWLARQVSRPLKAVSSAAREMASGNLGVRVTPKPTDDEASAQLAQSFNYMAESLGKLEAGRKAMVADIAHELRTPLTVLQGRLEAIQDGIVELNQAEISRLHSQTLLLGQLVEDLRTLSLADEGKLTLKRQPLDIGHWLRVTATSFEPQIIQAGLSLKLEIPEEPLVAHIDPGRMAQVVGNLLSNALAHTKQGSITVGISFADTLCLWVSDTGTGLAPGDFEKVFERYRSSQSSGLGLAIAKTIVGLHGGSITASNNPEGGAIFTVQVPSE